jgi:hypothetical protein
MALPYRNVAVLNEGLVRIEHPRYGTHLWTGGNVRGASKRCENCRKDLKSGERAFKPLSNGLNRGDRLCPECATGAKKVSPPREVIPETACFNCYTVCNEEDFCFGCKKYVCEKCGVNISPPFGSHDPEVHLTDEEH